MLQKLLRLLGLGAKVDAIGDEMDAVRDTLREANRKLRADVGLDTPKITNGRARGALAGKDGAK